MPRRVGSSVTEAEPTGLTLTVYFDTYQYVDGSGVVLKRVATKVRPRP